MNENVAMALDNFKTKGIKSQTREFENYKAKSGDIDLVKIYLEQMGRFSLCTPEEERKFFENYKVGDVKAKNWFAERNLPLVVNIAKRYGGKGMPLLDLIQEGNCGLLKAIDKFDLSKGCKFSTYARWWIRQAITRAFPEQSRTIRYSVNMTESIKAYKKFVRLFEQENGYSPDEYQIAEKLGISVERVREIERCALEIISLQTTVGEEDDTYLQELIPAKDRVEETYENAEIKEVLKEALGNLSERQAKILSLRFGLEKDETTTLQTIGKEWGMTRERIRQIEEKALKRLKATRKDLRVYLD